MSVNISVVILMVYHLTTILSLVLKVVINWNPCNILLRVNVLKCLFSSVRCGPFLIMNIWWDMFIFLHVVNEYESSKASRYTSCKLICRKNYSLWNPLYYRSVCIGLKMRWIRYKIHISNSGQKYLLFDILFSWT